VCCVLKNNFKLYLKKKKYKYKKLKKNKKWLEPPS
jgi:hypothetical protein